MHRVWCAGHAGRMGHRSDSDRRHRLGRHRVRERRSRSATRGPVVAGSPHRGRGAGLLVLVIALDGPPDTFADTSFAVHMAQHLLIQQVAAPLLLLGAPITLVLRADPRWLRRRVLVRVLRSRAVYVVSRPPVAFMLFAVTLVASHLTGFYDLALRNENVHALEHVVYLATALLFWYPAVGIDPGPSRPEHADPTLLSAADHAGDGASRPCDREHRHESSIRTTRRHPPPWGATPLQDQHLAGTLDVGLRHDHDSAARRRRADAMAGPGRQEGDAGASPSPPMPRPAADNR